MSAWPQDPIFATNLSFGIEPAIPLEIKYHPFAFDDLLLASHRWLNLVAAQIQLLPNGGDAIEFHDLGDAAFIRRAS
jgi:hypothetical protein